MFLFDTHWGNEPIASALQFDRILPECIIAVFFAELADTFTHLMPQTRSDCNKICLRLVLKCGECTNMNLLLIML